MPIIQIRETDWYFYDVRVDPDGSPQSITLHHVLWRSSWGPMGGNLRKIVEKALEQANEDDAQTD